VIVSELDPRFLPSFPFSLLSFLHLLLFSFDLVGNVHREINVITKRMVSLFPRMFQEAKELLTWFIRVSSAPDVEETNF
jgi:hypothetical protein